MYSTGRRGRKQTDQAQVEHEGRVRVVHVIFTFTITVWFKVEGAYYTQVHIL